MEHDPEKCDAVFRKDHAQDKKLKRDDDSSLYHRALESARHRSGFSPQVESEKRGQFWQKKKAARRRPS
jgi:hypothetical protein